MDTFGAAYPWQDHVLLHPGGTRLVGAGRLNGDVDAWERLKQALAVEASGNPYAPSCPPRTRTWQVKKMKRVRPQPLPPASGSRAARWSAAG